MTTSPLLVPLKSLLPSTTAIPPHLLSSATSLLSLSRQRAANLKPEEEVARVHACAEIACKKLRAHLRLPNIKSGNGAPCRPAVYKRLLTFLEGVLGDVDVVGTPQKRKGDDGDGRNTPVTGGWRSTGGRKRVIEDLVGGDDEDGDVEMMETPTKKRKVAGGTPTRTPTKSKGKRIDGFLGRIQASTGKGKAKGKAQQAQDEAPEYILPTIRTLCKVFKTPKMVPHVYTGVCISIDLAHLHSDSDIQDQAQIGELEKVQESLKTRHLCLTLAVFTVTLTRMHEGDMTQETFDAITGRGLIITGLNDSQDLKTEIEEWVNRITMWATEAESAVNWIDSIPLNTLAPFKLSKSSLQGSESGSKKNGSINDSETVRVRTLDSRQRRGNRPSRKEEIMKELEKEDADDVLLPGLGTMVHDMVDYFSAERVAEYAEWKAGILREIEEIEKGKGGRKGKTVAADVN